MTFQIEFSSMADNEAPESTIAFQGAYGAYSDLACRTVYPEMTTLPCETFRDAFEAVRMGQARLGMIPVDNSVAGRVADVHHLLPENRLHIVGEHYHRISHHLLALPGARIEDLKTVHSHMHALAQCRSLIQELGLKAIVHTDTAGAAAEIARAGDPTQAAIGSELACKIYGLQSLRTGVEDAPHNTTRFLIMAREPRIPQPDGSKVMTTFIFRVRSVPAALYKALGGFATNGVNLTKLESYMVDGRFTVAQFYADIEGHPEERPVRMALEELDFYAREVRILGVYPSHPFRLQANQASSQY